MSERINDGGAAFPRVGEGVGNPHYDVPGMSLRDWFAGQALVSMNWRDATPSGEWDAADLPEAAEARARLAYQQADAMLAARLAGAQP